MVSPLPTTNKLESHLFTYEDQIPQSEWRGVSLIDERVNVPLPDSRFILTAIKKQEFMTLTCQEKRRTNLLDSSALEVGFGSMLCYEISVRIIPGR